MCRELTRNSQPVRNKNRENTRQRKQLHAQDNIYVVRQFAYVHGVAGISLLSRKIQSAATVFHTLSRRQQQQNPNHKKWFLHHTHRIHNGLQNGSKIFPRGVASDPQEACL